MSAVNESTPLLNGEQDANILVDRSSPRSYHSQKKRFHLCSFLGLLILIALGVLATSFFVFNNKISPFRRVKINSSDLLVSNTWPLPDENTTDISYSSNISEIVNEALKWSKGKLNEKRIIESLTEPIDLNSPSYKHQNAIVSSQIAYNQSVLGFIENLATLYLRQNSEALSDVVVHYESANELKWAQESGCDKLSEHIECNKSAYRSIDGSCNNRNHPKKWGVAMTPFRRAILADYADEVYVPRGGFRTKLPSARDVSTKVHRPVHREDAQFTVMLAVYGQFIDHDMTATALSKGANGETISCCGSNITHPECFPVLLSEDDEYYSHYNVTCMEFVRSAPALRCAFGPREQLNQASSYLDASVVYGNTEELNRRLRTHQDGQLEVSYTADGRSLLPISTDLTDGCNQKTEIKEGRYCFLSGDSRANENLHLTSMHLIFVRQHNQLVKELKKLNSQWNDEKLYQEARRIVAAQIQHITYNEFVPIVIGSNMANKLNLLPLKNGYWKGYNSTIDASIANNFATSSFRFAHTLIPRMMKILANDTSSPEYIEMNKMLFNPFSLYEGELDSILRGAYSTKAEKADNYFTTELTEHLFENKIQNKSSYGLDLVALNIQRGRDHGLPSYPFWREHCGFPSVKTFEDLRSVFDSESLEAVSSIYSSVDKIDLYTGSLSELPIEGGLVGPVLTCLIADQFFRLKYGDRFWYETNEKPQAFTESQLNEIRKTSLAGIICNNADDLQYITPKVMLSVSKQNARIHCSNIPKPNMIHWMDIASNIESHNEIPVTSFSDEGDKKTSNKGNNNITEIVCRKKLQVTAIDLHNVGSKTRIVIPPIVVSLSNLLDLVAQIYNLNSTFKGSAAPELVPPSFIVDTMFIWEPTNSSQVTGYFLKNNVNITFTLTYKNVDDNCVNLTKKGCTYYSKVLLEQPISEDLFDVNVDENVYRCSVIAPVIFDEILYANGTLLWNGTLSVIGRNIKATLDKENELSLHLQSKRIFDLNNLKGSAKINSDDGVIVLWNGSLPTIFELIPMFSVFSNNEIVAYTISWSGFYEEHRFYGNFLLPVKLNGTINWYDGNFTVDLSSIPEIKSLIRPKTVYYSIIYLKNNTDINKFDWTAWKISNDWNYDVYSEIILVGNFTNKGFVWFGSTRIIISENQESLDIKQLNYRPDGKYLITVINATVYTNSSNSKVTLWSGDLPGLIRLPVSYDNRIIIWSYDETKATFSTIGNGSNAVFGNFVFNSTWLLGNIKGLKLKPKITYYSPITFENSKYSYPLNEYKLPDLLFNELSGVIAPVQLLGDLKNNSFEWNGKFVITVFG